MSFGLCRLCVVKIEPNLLNNVLDSEIFTKIQMHLNIDIQLNDINASLVCAPCMEKINEFHEYYKRVHENQERFNHIFTNQIKHTSIASTQDDFETVTLEITKNLECQLEETPDENISDIITCGAKNITKSSNNNDNVEIDPLQPRKNVKKRKTNCQSKINVANKAQKLLIQNEEKTQMDLNKIAIKTELNASINEEQFNDNISDNGQYDDDNDNNFNYEVCKTFKSELEQEKSEKEFEEFPKSVVKDGKFQIQGVELTRHMQRFFLLTCDLCPAESKGIIDNVTSSTFPTLKSLFLHYKKVHEVKGYVSCCGKKLHRKNMTHHFALHVNPEEYTCKQCNHVANTPYYLKIHMEMKHFPDENRKKYACTLCERIYKSSKSLKYHQLEKHPSEDQEFKFQCQKCDKSFNTAIRIQEHIKSVHTNETHICDICGMKFRLKGNLKSHRNTHDLNKVKCEICGTWLKNEHVVRKHFLRNHSSTVLLKCDECDYTTMIKRNLTKHKRLRHSKEKPHGCPYCDHKFKSRTNLNDHITQHTGVKTQCEFCPKEFITKSNYYAHRKKCHFEEIEKLNRQREEELLASKLRASHQPNNYITPKNEELNRQREEELLDSKLRASHQPNNYITPKNEELNRQREEELFASKLRETYQSNNYITPEIEELSRQREELLDSKLRETYQSNNYVTPETYEPKLNETL